MNGSNSHRGDWTIRVVEDEVSFVCYINEQRMKKQRRSKTKCGGIRYLARGRMISNRFSFGLYCITFTFVDSKFEVVRGIKSKSRENETQI
jgi:hypothetical protein